MSETGSGSGGRDAEMDRLIEEARALALYVARHGDSLGDDADQTLYKALVGAIPQATSRPSQADWQTLITAYAKVTAVTYKVRGVNGRTILDTQQEDTHGGRPKITARSRPMALGIVLFVLVLVIEGLLRWSGDVSDRAALAGREAVGHLIINTLATFLVPALWGGLGTCIFLMKRITDTLLAKAYERARMRGDGTRIFLGAMLGVVVVVLFFPNFGEHSVVGEMRLGPATAAFIAGLGVKPVYAAFESLSEELARRFKGSKGGSGQ